MPKVITRDWYNANKVDRVRLVLELQEQYSYNEYITFFNVKSKRVIADFMNGQGYIKRDGKYVKKEEEVSVVSNEIIDLRFIEELKEMLNWYKNRNDNNVIEVIDTGIQLPEVTEIIRTTVRLDSVILNDFVLLCKTKYKIYKQYDIWNLALKEFIDKNKE